MTNIDFSSCFGSFSSFGCFSDHNNLLYISSLLLYDLKNYVR
jgi:hypothetical protein